MQLVDLTLELTAAPESPAIAAPTIVAQEWRLVAANGPYTARVYDFSHNGMAGTYIDYPGHIRETDDGADAANTPILALYRRRATVIRLGRGDDPGEITAADLAAAAPRGRRRGDALIINALGERRFDQIAARSVWLGTDAVDWIVAAGTDLLVSDVYERVEVLGIFRTLFAAGVRTVCRPVNLHLLPAGSVRLTALPLRCPGVTQIPCRLLAEIARAGGQERRVTPADRRNTR